MNKHFFPKCTIFALLFAFCILPFRILRHRKKQKSASIC